jgi:hypothetical protein
MRIITLTLLFLCSLCVLAAPAAATPITEPVTVEALEVFETSRGDEKFVCARYQGEGVPLVPGSIKGVNFIPVKGSVKKLKVQIARAQGQRRRHLAGRLATLQKKTARCKREGTLSPLVVEAFSCGHYVGNLTVSTGDAATVQEAFDESLQQCEEYLALHREAVDKVYRRLTGSTYITGECALFGCGIVPEGVAWNVYQYYAAGTILSCNKSDCKEELFEAPTIQRSAEEAKTVALQQCEETLERLKFERVLFDDYTTSVTQVPCFITSFVRYISSE